MTTPNKVYGASVRLRYSVTVNFLFRILSMFASLLFVVMVTRRLPVDEFGIWTMILKYVNYTLPLSVIFAYWLPRTISRGINTAKTGLMLAVALSFVALAGYVVVVYMASTYFEQPLIPLLLAAIIVLENYINQCLYAISTAHAPQYIGFAQFTLRVLQVILGFPLVVFYRWGLYGVVLSTIGARMGVLLLLLLVNYKVISESKIDFKVAKSWFKKSWIPIYESLLSVLLALDVLIVRSIVGSEEPIAYYGVSISLMGLMIFSTQAAPALYARLLAKRDVRDVVDVFWLMYMLSFPMVVGVLIHAETILAVYNIKYVVASHVARIFSASSLLLLLVSILGTTLKGLEVRDYTSEDVNLRETVLFKVPTLNFLSIIIYLSSLAILSRLFHHDVLAVSLLWGITYCSRFVFLIVTLNWLLKREFSVSLPYGLFLKYISRFLVASIGIVAVKFAFPIEPQISIYPLLRDLALIVLPSALAYFSTLYVIDPKMREFVKAAWSHASSFFDRFQG
ncbi:MAG: hypothetical protein DRJ59_04070 [Thermoprotei archaeon]|nr:MAG: hypothetical protein DRJ59_04070 [Thermoprotei archaeon]